METALPVYLLINIFDQGGAETVNLDLAIELARLGYTPHFLILRGRGKPDITLDGVTVHHLCLDGTKPRKIKSSRHPAVVRLRQLFEDTGGGGQLEHALGAFASLSLANKLLSFFPRRKTVFWLHFPVTYSDFKNKNWFRKITRKHRLAKLYAGKKIAIPSLAAKQDFERIFGVNHADIHTIYCPISAERIKQLSMETPDQEVARMMDASPDYWVHAARFVEQKRHDRLLKAFKLFCERVDSEIKLVCLGDGQLWSQTRELAESLGLVDRIIFLGYISNPYPVIRKAKAFILSSDFEALPTVLLEALALEVPCLSTRCPTGPDEILVDELSAWLVSMNEEALAEGMRRIERNLPDVSGYDLCRFAPTHVAKQYVDLLQS